MLKEIEEGVMNAVDLACNVGAVLRFRIPGKGTMDMRVRHVHRDHDVVLLNFVADGFALEEVCEQFQTCTGNAGENTAKDDDVRTTAILPQ